MALGVWLNDWVRWIIAAARFGGAISLMPGLSSHQVPLLARATVAFGVALSGIASVPNVNIDNFVGLALLIAREAAIGMLVGFSFSAFVYLAEWAAEVVDWQVGFGFSALVDPILGTKAAIVARAATLLAGLLFFQLDGHHWLIRAISFSYRVLPVGTDLSLKPQLGSSWMGLISGGLLEVLPFVVPAIGIVLLTDLALGMMGRAAPQLSVLLWGMPARIALAVLAAAFSFASLPTLCGNLLNKIALSVPDLLASMR